MFKAIEVFFYLSMGGPKNITLGFWDGLGGVWQAAWQFIYLFRTSTKKRIVLGFVSFFFLGKSENTETVPFV